MSGVCVGLRPWLAPSALRWVLKAAFGRVVHLDAPSRSESRGRLTTPLLLECAEGPVQPDTVTVPTMSGWSAQKIEYSPGSSKLTS